MKKFILACMALFTIGTAGFSQSPGTYYFGSQSDPAMAMAPSYDGYNTFKTAIRNNTDGETVDWERVIRDINGIPSLSSYQSWLQMNLGLPVWIYCCDGEFIPCLVMIPQGCHICECGPVGPVLVE